MNEALLQDIFVGRVRGLSSKGMGVVESPEGQVFFVRGAFPEEEVKVQIISRQKRYGFAKLLEVITPSLKRRPSPCPHHGLELGDCSGCPWITLEYHEQLKHKQHRLIHALERLKIPLSKSHISPIIPSQDEFHYRNRAQLKSDGEKIGYLSEGSKVLAPIKDCLCLAPKPRELLKKMLDSLPNSHWKPSENYLWSFLEIDEWMEFEEIKSNKRRPFFQGNSKQNEEMKNWVEKKIKDLKKSSPFLELFSGSGNFTEIISKNLFEKIWAIEVQGEAVKNLESKKLNNVEIIPMNLYEKGIWWNLEKHCSLAEIVLLDPPREGLGNFRGLFKALKNLHTVIYISCDVESFSNDIKEFLAHGFVLTEIQPLDQFPQTPHLEVLSVLKR